MKLLPRVVLLIVLLAGVMWVVLTHQIPSYERPGITIEGLGVPALKALTVLEGKIDKSQVKLATVIDPTTVTQEAAVADLLTLYAWGAEQIEPGGAVDIVLLVEGRNTVPTKNGPAALYYILLEVSLEKTQIDRLLRQPPISMEQLVQFHTKVAKSTNEAGGMIYAPDTAVPYTGLNK